MGITCKHVTFMFDHVMGQYGDVVRYNVNIDKHSTITAYGRIYENPKFIATTRYDARAFGITDKLKTAKKVVFSAVMVDGKYVQREADLTGFLDALHAIKCNDKKEDV